MRPRLIRTDFAARLQWDRSRHKLRLRLCYQACGQHSQRQQQISPSTYGLATPDAKYFRSSSHRRIRGLDQEAARISGRRNSCSRTLIDDLKSGAACDASAGLAVFHALRAQVAQAAECAERACEERYPPLLGIVAPLLRPTPQWPALARRMIALIRFRCAEFGVATACNHPNCLVLPFRTERMRLIA